jgi:hypothetical protein
VWKIDDDWSLNLIHLISNIAGISVMILVCVMAYMGVFLYPVEPIEGIPTDLLRSIVAIAFWILAQGIWQAISQFTKITFGTAFQAGILIIVGAMVSTYWKLGYVQVTMQTAALFAAILIATALFDNLPRLFTQDEKKSQEEKPKRNIGLFDKFSTKRLETDDEPDKDAVYFHKLDYLNRSSDEHA